jgi:hypothetical protein
MKSSKKILGLSFVAFLVVFNLGVFLKPAKASMNPEPYCYGWKYYMCHDEVMVIRCTCAGGQICYASWQGPCE